MKVEARIARIPQPLTPPDWNRALMLLPQVLREGVLRFHRWQDRHSALAGKLLLRQGLLLRGGQLSDLDRIKRTEFGRPYLEGWLDFNISHCDGLAVCAFAECGRVGVDVEVEREIDISDFTKLFSEREWALIRANQSPLSEFYRTWTRKESVLKADGSGLQLSPISVRLEERRAELEKVIYETQELDLGGKFIACLSCSESFNDLELVWDDDWYKPVIPEIE